MPKKQPQQKAHPVIEWSSAWKRYGGLALVLGSFGLMRMWFWWGVAVFYLGWLWAFCEWSVDQWPLQRKRIQLVGFAVLMTVFDVVTIGVVTSPAPVEIMAYTLPTTHEDGAAVHGIVWDHRLAELWIAISNPTSDDYNDLDVTITSDFWTHQAVIVEGPGCTSTPADGPVLKINKLPLKTSTDTRFGATRIGNGFEAYDNLGNEYETVAWQLGYRIRCATLPERSTVKILFALVDIPDNLKAPPVGHPGSLGLTVNAFKVGSGSWFDVVNPRPNPKVVNTVGKYRSGIKPFNHSRKVLVVAEQS